MIKYIVIKYTPDGYGGNLSEEKTINKSELNLFLDNGWVLHKKLTLVKTLFLDWWSTISSADKISIFGILIPMIVAIFFGVLSHLSNKKNDTLEIENKILKENYTQLKLNLVRTTDSLRSERKKSKKILKEYQSKKVSDRDPFENKN